MRCGRSGSVSRHQNQHMQHATHTTKEGSIEHQKRHVSMFLAWRCPGCCLMQHYPRYQGRNTPLMSPFSYSYRREASPRCPQATSKKAWRLPRPPPLPRHHYRLPHPRRRPHRPPSSPPSLKMPPSFPRIPCAHPSHCKGTILLPQPQRPRPRHRPACYASSPARAAAPRGPWQGAA